MRNSNNDVEALLQALRQDLPTPADQARARARLIAAGGLAAGALTSIQAAAAVGSNTVAGGTAAGTVTPIVSQAGFWTQVSALSAVTKVGVGTVLAAAVASTSVPQVRETLFSSSAMVSSNPPTVNRARADFKPQLTSQQAVGQAPLAEAQLTQPQLTQPQLTQPQLTQPPEVAKEARLLPVSPRGESVAGLTEPLAGSAVSPRTGTAPRTMREQSSVPNPPPLVRAASSLSQETPLIEQALVALQAGDKDGARYWLGEHARRFPSGLLAQERVLAVARVQSLR
jgi:TolA-binding protein